MAAGASMLRNRLNECSAVAWQRAEGGVLRTGMPEFMPEVVVKGTVLLDHAKGRRLVGVGRQEGTVIEITRYPFLIGKLEEEMDCIIDHPSVSRMHARISENKHSAAGSCYIEDFNSTNGTYVNGVRIEPYRKRTVNVGDVIRLADQEFVLR